MLRNLKIWIKMNDFVRKCWLQKLIQDMTENMEKSKT